MDIEFWFRIILSSLVPILAFFFRKFKPNNSFKHSISFNFLRELNLNKNYLDNFPDIQIYFKKKLINKNLKIIEFEIQNTGNVDIDNQMFVDDLSMVIPSEYEILRFLITKYSDKIGLTFRHTNNIIEFNWLLLKPKESFSCKCLLVSKSNESYILNSDKDFFEKISFEHRIKNVSSIEKYFSASNEKMNIPLINLKREGYKDILWASLFLFLIPPIFDFIISILGKNDFKYFEWNWFNIGFTIFNSIAVVFYILSARFTFREYKLLKEKKNIEN